MAKKIDEIDRHSQEVQDLLGRIPSWLIRYGTIMVITLLIVLLSGCWLFKYPDLVSGPVVVTVDGKNPNRLTGLLYLNRKDMENIKMGQQVNMKFPDYPYLEFGVVVGVVGNISSAPTSDGYEVEIQLPGQLITTIGTKLDFRQEMKGNGEIVTEDKRLLNRILGPVKAVFGKGKRK